MIEKSRGLPEEYRRLHDTLVRCAGMSTMARRYVNKDNAIIPSFTECPSVEAISIQVGKLFADLG